MGTQGASLGAWPAPIVQAQRMPRKHPYVSRLSATPHPGERSQNAKPGRKKRAAGTRSAAGNGELELFRWVESRERRTRSYPPPCGEGGERSEPGGGRSWWTRLGPATATPTPNPSPQGG